MLKKLSDDPIYFLSYKDIECSCFKSTKERKAKRRVAIKEINDELLNLGTIQDKMEKNYPINEHQVTEIVELYHEIWKFDDPIKDLEIFSAKINAEEEIELIKTTKEKLNEFRAKLECNQDLIMQEESETIEIFSDLYRKSKGK